MFPGIDLDLELERTTTLLRSELENQMRRMRSLIAVALAKPRQGVSNRVDDATDRLRLRLNEIDVFRIAQRLREEEFIDGRATECVNIFETNFPDLYRRRSLRRLIKTWSMPGLFFYARVA